MIRYKLEDDRKYMIWYKVEDDGTNGIKKRMKVIVKNKLHHIRRTERKLKNGKRYEKTFNGTAHERRNPKQGTLRGR